MNKVNRFLLLYKTSSLMDISDFCVTRGLVVHMGWRAAYVAGLVLTGLVLTACSPSAEAGAERLRLRVGFMASLNHAPAIMGAATGVYAKALDQLHYDFEPVLFPTGPAIIEGLYANRIDVAYVGPGPAINGYVRSEGRALKIITGCSANGVAIVARRGSGVTTVTELISKRVAVPALGNTQYLSAVAFLRELETKADCRVGSTRIIPCSGADAEILLRKGQLDAAWLPEPWPSRLEEQGDAYLVCEEQVLWTEKRFPSAVVVARGDFLEANRSAVEALVTVHHDVCTSLAVHREEWLTVLGNELFRLTKKKLPQSVLARALSRIEFTSDPMHQQIGKFYKLAVQSGFVRTAPATDIEGLFWEVGTSADAAPKHASTERDRSQSTEYAMGATK